jgi:ubiquinone/menaquinone biosynthesis C-methylase UbiE
VFSEIYRVLKKGGIFYIWDIVIDQNIQKEKPIICIPIDVKYNEKIYHVDYGVNWKDNEQNKELFKEAGLKLKKDNSKEKLIEIIFEKQ